MVVALFFLEHTASFTSPWPIKLRGSSLELRQAIKQAILQGQIEMES
jgi:hypothetical protein